VDSMRIRHPDVQFEVNIGNFNILMEQLGHRELDVVLGPLDGRVSTAGYVSALIGQDETAIVASTGHCIHHGRAKWHSLAEHIWVLPPRGSLIRSAFEYTLLQKQAAIPRPVIETNSLPTQLTLLERGDYLALLHRSIAAYYQKLGLLKIVALRIISNSVPLAAFWEGSQAGALTKDLIEELRHHSG